MKNKSTKVNPSFTVANTLVVETIGQGRNQKVVPVRDDADKLVYTNKVRISIQNPPDGYEFPPTLELSRIQDWADTKSKEGETLRFVKRDYRAINDSLTEFEATDDKPEMISLTYAPVKSSFKGLPV